MYYSEVQFLIHGASATLVDCKDEDTLYSVLTSEFLDYMKGKGVTRLLFGKSSEYSAEIEDLYAQCELNSEE